MQRPLFVVTAPRSGSTYAVGILDSHPRVAMTNEAAWITLLRKASLLAGTPALEPIDDGEGFSTVGILPHRYLASLSAAFGRIVEPFVEAFYGEVGAHGDFYGDKILSRNDLAFAVERFPGAKYVELVRDARDVIVSSYAFERKQPTAWQDAPFDARCRHLDEFFRATDALLEGRDRHLLRYEDLVSDNAAVVARLFAWLGLTVTREVTAYLEGAARDLFASQGTSDSPGSSVGRWRKDMTGDQQRAATDALREHLVRFGYEASQD